MVADTIGRDLQQEKQVLDGLEDLGISLALVTKELEDEGVASFSKAFESLLEAIEGRRLDVI